MESQRMKEAPRRLVASAGLLILAFGAGVVFGRPTQGRMRPAAQEEAETGPDRAEVKRELAACRRELRESATRAALSEEARRKAPELAARIESLENKLKECRRDEVLAKADLCGSLDRHAVVMTVLMNGDESCADKAGIGDLMAKGSEACSEFENIEETIDLDGLTVFEKRRVKQAAANDSTHHGVKVPGLVSFEARDCMKRRAKVTKE
jgi:hypothetical protein